MQSKHIDENTLQWGALHASADFWHSTAITAFLGTWFGSGVLLALEKGIVWPFGLDVWALLPPWFSGVFLASGCVLSAGALWLSVHRDDQAVALEVRAADEQRARTRPTPPSIKRHNRDRPPTHQPGEDRLRWN